MTIKTYVFGNPSGWTLYEEDETENDYFKSFYITSRHGDRLMVNRRIDGTTVYTYVNYDLLESSDRCGLAHFGMSVVIDGGTYTTDFAAIYSFMQQLFTALLQRHDCPFVKSGNKFRYRINKLKDAASAIEWIKEIMPRIFDKVKTESLIGDSSFSEGTVGRVITLPDDIEPQTSLDAFRQSRWVAISPLFKETVKTPGGPQSEYDPSEISLRDLELQHKLLMQKILDMAIEKKSATKPELDAIANRIKESRALLAEFITASPDNSEKEKAKEIIKDYGLLNDQVYALASKHAEPQRAPQTQPSTTIKESQPKTTINKIQQKLRPRQTDRIPTYQLVLGGIIAIAMFITFALIFLKPDIDPQTGQDQDITEVTDDSIKEDSDSIDADNSLKRLSIEKKLWEIVENQDKETIKSYFNDSDNSANLEKLGFTDESDNGLAQWNAYIDLYTEFNKILKKGDWGKDRTRFNECIAIIDKLPAFARPELTERASQRQQDCEKRDESHLPPIGDSHPTGNLSIKCNGVKKEFKKDGIGFDVIVGTNFTVTSDLPLKYSSNPNIEATPKSDKKNWTIKIKQKGKFIFTTTDKPIYTITFTAQ